MKVFPRLYVVNVIERFVERDLMNYKDQNDVIMSDSQSAIRALRLLLTNSNMVWECLRKLNDLGRKNSHSPVDTRHVGWEGNEEAYKLARKEVAISLVGPEPFCDLGAMFFKGVIRKRQK